MDFSFLKKTVDMSGDGITLSPAAYAQLLTNLTAQREIPVDNYAEGGIVSEFEKKAARRLGKEDALILPTGTLANLLALSELAGQGSRVLVQHDSHVYQDSGDAAQSLGGMNLITFKPGLFPDASDLSRVLDSFADQKVKVPIKVLHVESPVRRLHEAAFELEAFDRVIACARKKKLRLHLDGARLFVWSVWCNRSVAALAAPFDTVYVSLWKTFNSLFGAILAGPAEMIAGLRSKRRRGGGAPAHIWPVALVADYFMDGFEERLQSAKSRSTNILTELGSLPGVRIEAPTNGTNACLLCLDSVKPDKIADLVHQLRLSHVRLPAWNKNDGGFWIKVNETWNNLAEEQIIDAFQKALPV